MKIKHFFTAVLILFLIFPTFVHAEDTTPVPYQADEFPQGLKDLRRFEIIALGSMPFVTLDVNIAYSIGKPIFSCMKTGDWSTYTFENPLTASSSYTTDEMKGIIWTSIGISVGIALTDYIINIVRRHKIQRAENYNQTISIYNITQDPDAVKIEPPRLEQESPQTDEAFQNQDDSQVEFIEGEF